MFQETHWISHCISHWDINIKRTGNIINVTRFLWLIILLWTGWIFQLFCLANARVVCGNDSIGRRKWENWITQKIIFIVSPQNSRSLGAISWQWAPRTQKKQRGNQKRKKQMLTICSIYLSALLGILFMIWVMRVPKIHDYIYRLIVRKKWHQEVGEWAYFPSSLDAEIRIPEEARNKSPLWESSLNMFSAKKQSGMGELKF